MADVLDLLPEEARDLAVLLDEELRIVRSSRSFERLFPAVQGESTLFASTLDKPSARKVSDLLYDLPPKGGAVTVCHLTDAGESLNVDYSVYRAAGDSGSLLALGRRGNEQPQPDLDARSRDMRQVIEELTKSELTLAGQPATDELTGLMSRRRLLEMLDVEIARARRYRGALACIIVDLDHYEHFSTEYDERFATRAVIETGRILREACRRSDYVGRFGDGQFLIVAPETHEEGAGAIAERVRGPSTSTSSSTTLD